jgi:YHS domain-containing protein
MRAIALFAWLVACGTPAAQPTQTAAAAFRNDAGELVCPVMGDVMPSEEQAAGGHTVYNGKDYYFCCSSCAELFAADPEKFADGRYLATMGAPGGEEAHCSE